MATLFSATLDLAKILGSVMESKASEESLTPSSALIDTFLPRTPPPDDAYNYGTLWFITGDNAGLTAVVTDWDQAPKPTFTFSSMPDDITINNRYAFLDKDWPRDVLRNAVNAALQTIGGVPDIYTNASFKTVANQEDYTLPTDVYNVREVEIATSASSPYYYQKHYHWDEIDGVIRFKNGYAQTSSGDLIRLTYMVQPAELDDDSDTISDYVHPDRLKWTAAVNALLWKLPSMGEQSMATNQKLQMATQMERMMAMKHRLPSKPKITLARWA